MAITNLEGLLLSRQEIVYTDETTFPGDTLVGKVTATDIPASLRTSSECRWIFRINADGTMTKPIMLPTDAPIIPRLNTINPDDFNKYYTFGQVWDNRANYTYA